MSRARRIPVILVAALGSLLASSGRADLDATLARIQEAQKGVATIQASFSQEKKAALLSRPLVSTGTLVIAKPDRFLWAVDSPDRSAFVLEGSRARSLLPVGQGQAVDVSRFRRVADLMKQMTDLFAGDISAKGSLFRVEDATPERVPRTLTLVPLDDQVKRYFARIEVTFAADLRSVASIRFLEPHGDETRLRFTHVVLNAPVDFAARVAEWESHAK